MYNLAAIYIMWKRDILRLARDKARFISSLGQPLIWLLLIGGGLAPTMRFASITDAQDFDYMKFMFPGVIGMSILFTSMFSAISVAWDREFGFLKEILVAPVPRWAIAVGKMLGGSSIAVFQGALMLVLAPFLGVSTSFEAILLALPLMFLLSFAVSSLGLLVATYMRTMEGFQVVMQFLMMPMFMLSGAVFPLRNLPSWMEVLVKVNPVAYGMDPIRQVLLAPSVPATTLESLSFNAMPLDLAVMGGFTLVTMSLAVWRFSVAD